MPFGHLSLEHMCELSEGTEPEVEISETDISTILYTSGSTDLSKGVVRTHRMSCEYAMPNSGRARILQDGADLHTVSQPCFFTPAD